MKFIKIIFKKVKNFKCLENADIIVIKIKIIYELFVLKLGAYNKIDFITKLVLCK